MRVDIANFNCVNEGIAEFANQMNEEVESGLRLQRPKEEELQNFSSIELFNQVLK